MILKRDVPIAKMINGDELEGFYLLKTADIRTTAAGKPYLTGAISDMSGKIDFVFWDYSGPVGKDETYLGNAIKVRGKVSDYKGGLQLGLTNIRMATSEDAYDPTKLVPTAPIDRDDALRTVNELIASIEDEDYRKVAIAMLSKHLNMFKKIPAAKSVHHGFIAGLLMHTSNMMKAADMLSGLYSEVIDRSLLLTGTLCHDLAKEKEFTFSKLGIVSDYSVKGQLLGHLVMGAQDAEETCREQGTPEEKSILLQHLILSHHGEPEYGAAVRPLCAEAELLHYIDKIDSRMEIYAEAYAAMEPGTVSEKSIFALDHKIYKHE